MLGEQQDQQNFSSSSRWFLMKKLIFPFLHHLEKEKIRKTEHKEHKQQFFLFLEHNKGGRKTGGGWSFSYAVRNIFLETMNGKNRKREKLWMKFDVYRNQNRDTFFITILPSLDEVFPHVIYQVAIFFVTLK